jgi:hypothetical protein
MIYLRIRDRPNIGRAPSTINSPGVSEPILNGSFKGGEGEGKQSEGMAAFPLSGRMVPEKKDPLIRETLVGSYRIIYRVDESKKVVALARIWHSARGTPEL